MPWCSAARRSSPTSTPSSGAPPSSASRRPCPCGFGPADRLERGLDRDGAAFLAWLGADPSHLLGQGGEAQVFALDGARVVRLHRPGADPDGVRARSALLAELAVGADRVPFAIPEVLEIREREGHLAPEITPTSRPEDEAFAREWLASRGLAQWLDDATRWLAAFWSGARDHARLQAWCRRILSDGAPRD